MNTAPTGRRQRKYLQSLGTLTPRKLVVRLKFNLSWHAVFDSVPHYIYDVSGRVSGSRVEGCNLCPGPGPDAAAGPLCVRAYELRVDFTSLKGCKKREKEKNVCQRLHAWPARPKTFAFSVLALDRKSLLPRSWQRA